MVWHRLLLLLHAPSAFSPSRYLGPITSLQGLSISRDDSFQLHRGKCLSVHKAQGDTLDDLLLHLRKARGPTPDRAIIHVAVSRATCLASLKMLFPVTLDQLQTKPDRDNMALMSCIEERYIYTSASFVRLKSGCEASTSSQDAEDSAGGAYGEVDAAAAAAPAGSDGSIGSSNNRGSDRINGESASSNCNGGGRGTETPSLWLPPNCENNLLFQQCNGFSSSSFGRRGTSRSPSAHSCWGLHYWRFISTTSPHALWPPPSWPPGKCMPLNTCRRDTLVY